MSRLNQIQPKKSDYPARVVIYGIEGVGKSTFGDEAPNSVFISPEGGTEQLKRGIALPNIKTFKDVEESVQELITGEHDYKSLILDSADWIEKLAHSQIVGAGTKSIITVNGGYGAGFRDSEMMHKRLIEKLSELREKRGMNIIVTAHYQVKKVKDPDAIADYDQFEIKCHEMVSSLWREWADALLFCRFETYIKDGGDEGKTIAKGSGKRIMFTEKRPAFQAKNRYGLPAQIDDVSWEAFDQARRTARINPLEGLVSEAKTLAQKIADPLIQEKVLNSIVDAKTENMLNAIIQRVKKITAEVEHA